MRILIPKRIEAEVLFLNHHTCCICRQRDKDVQIHHIDGDHANNSLENLAVLCLDCHSKVTGRRGLGKSYSRYELKRYKLQWQNVVRKSYGLATARRAIKIPKLERQLFQFEIKRLIHQMIGCNDSDKDTLNQNFDTLLSISILEGLEKEIISQLNFAFALTAINDSNKPVILANFLPRFFAYFVGPSEVPMKKSDEKNVLEAIETIEFAHDLCVEQNKRYVILAAFRDSLTEFAYIAITYKNHKIFRRSMAILKDIRQSCLTTFHSNDKKLPRLASAIDALQADIFKDASKARLRSSHSK